MKMRHLLKFNESGTSQNLSIIKDYFYNFVDDLDDICKLEFVEMNPNYFIVYIEKLKKIPTNITNDNLGEIDILITSNGEDSRILTELKSSIFQLNDENILDNFRLKRTSISSWSLEIYTKIEGDDYLNWIFVNDDYEVWLDKLRLTKFIKSKFDLNIKNAFFQEEYDKYNERYLYLEIDFESKITNATAKDIINEILKTECLPENSERKIKVFESGESSSYHAERTSGILLYLVSEITDFL